MRKDRSAVRTFGRSNKTVVLVPLMPFIIAVDCDMSVSHSAGKCTVTYEQPDKRVVIEPGIEERKANPGKLTSLKLVQPLNMAAFPPAK